MTDALNETGAPGRGPEITIGKARWALRDRFPGFDVYVETIPAAIGVTTTVGVKLSLSDYAASKLGADPSEHSMSWTKVYLGAFSGNVPASIEGDFAPVIKPWHSETITGLKPSKQKQIPASS